MDDLLTVPRPPCGGWYVSAIFRTAGLRRASLSSHRDLAIFFLWGIAVSVWLRYTKDMELKSMYQHAADLEMMACHQATQSVSTYGAYCAAYAAADAAYWAAHAIKYATKAS